MNKKFSTFMTTGFLAVGALFTTVNAADITDNVGDGLYYLIESGATTTSAATDWSGAAITGNLTYNAAAKNFQIVTVATPGTESSWILVKSKAATGEALPANCDGTKVQLKNFDGEVVKIDVTTGEQPATGAEAKNIVSTFYLCVDGANSYLCYVTTDGKTMVLGASASGIVTAYDMDALGAGESITTLDVVEIDPGYTVYTASDLNKELRNGFALNIPSSVKGNVLTGKLVAVPTSPTDPAEDQTSYYLKNSDGKYVYLTKDQWSVNFDKNVRGKSYKFTTITEHALQTLETEAKKAATFQIKQSKASAKDSLIVTTQINLGTEASADIEDVQLYIPTVDGTKYLTVAEVEDDVYATVEDIAGFPLVWFGDANTVKIADFAGKVWNVILKSNDGSVLSPLGASYNASNNYWTSGSTSIDNYNDLFIPAAQVELNKPEGQWLPVFGDALTFVNRESGENLDLSNVDVRKVADKEDQYMVYFVEFGRESSFTLIISEVAKPELGLTENGYASYNKAQELLDGKYLSIYNKATQDTVYVAKNADDEVYLTKDKAEAIEFRVKECAHDFTSHTGLDYQGLAGTDTLLHITSYLGADLKVAKDTVRFFQYMLAEQFTEKYLYYDSNTKNYKLDEWTWNNNDEFIGSWNPRFVMKEKGENSFNLLTGYYVGYPFETDHADESTEAETWDNDFNAALYAYTSEDESYIANTAKLYGGFQTAELKMMSKIYNYQDNDRFDLTVIETPEYMSLEAFKNIKVYREKDNNVMMYEQANDYANFFLGMENLSDPTYAESKGAMFVDTAYVRNNTYKPQYLLSVRANHVGEDFCSRPDLHGAMHKDTTYGEFLVNLVDSAYKYGINKKSNPFTYDLPSYYRLGFVKAIHTEDALYPLNAKGEKNGTKIDLDKNADRVATFAFRYVDAAREGVKMETLYDTYINGNNEVVPVRGWVKWHNGVPVVTSNYSEAEVFTVTPTEEVATSTDNIEATSVIIIAGEGQIVINGAAGKKVTISNVLGQTIANTVLSSDNTTIAAPAGVVVVAVEGEAAVKAIVK